MNLYTKIMHKIHKKNNLCKIDKFYTKLSKNVICSNFQVLHTFMLQFHNL